MVFVLLGSLWIGSSFASKLYLAYGLSSRVDVLRRDNAQLSESNRGYAAQLKSLSDPAGAEEVARQHNYVKPDEKVYVVVNPSPSASSSPGPTRSRRTPVPDSQPSLWQVLWSGLTGPFHH